MTDPAAPRLDGEFGDVAGMMHPHSYLRLPGGNVLATFQMQHGDSGNRPGGLAELTPARRSDAGQLGRPARRRPWQCGRIPRRSCRRSTGWSVTTSDMKDDFPASRTVQIWRLSDLTAAPLDQPARRARRRTKACLSAEPRVLEDGRTVLVSTFNCGLYLIEGSRPNRRRRGW